MKKKVMLILFTVLLVFTLVGTPVIARPPEQARGPFQELWDKLSDLEGQINDAVSYLQAQIDGIEPPITADIEALGFTSGPHAPTPTTADIEALGFTSGPHTWNDNGNNATTGNLEVGGEVSTTRVSYIAPRIHTLAIPAAAFYPSYNTDYNNLLGGGGACIKEGTGRLVAPVYLPEGAKLTIFRAYFYDISTSIDLSVGLWRSHFDGGGGGLAAPLAESSGNPPGYCWMETYSAHIVDTTSGGYYLQVTADGTGWDFYDTRIMGVRITYVINEAP